MRCFLRGHRFEMGEAVEVLRLEPGFLRGKRLREAWGWCACGKYKQVRYGVHGRPITSPAGGELIG